MKSAKTLVSGDENDEVAALVEVLLKTGQRLEELTAGQVDTIVDRDGRTFLLRGTQEQLRQSEMAKQAAILNALPASIALLDNNGLILSVNDSWRRFALANGAQCGPGYGVGLNYLEICDAAFGDGSSEAYQVAEGVRSVLDGRKKYFSCEYEANSDAEKRWFLLTAAPLADDRPNGAVVMHLDITEQKRISLEIVHLAEHDFLTGLPNRLLLNDRVTQAIAMAQRGSKQVSVLFLDLDGFKHINDSLGHRLGDKLLQSVAKRLENCIREPDTVSRQGGDEFVVLLSELRHPEDAAIAARRVLDAMAETFSIDQHDLHITTSIGVSIYPDDGLNSETLIKNADVAMYQAKENGCHTYQFFTPDMNVRAVKRKFLEENLRRALSRQEFALHYQPKINLKTGVITGAEALLRWTHPIRGPISPAEFIPVAEDCGLILQIGSWVLREACRQARAWADAGLPEMTIAVNVSGLQFQNENFLEGIFATLYETRLDPKFLEVEVTESLLMKRVEVTASILQSLRERGVRVAIDDFGTGYSSLSYLHKFPFDSLKIDQSFVRQISSDPNHNSIVKSIITMGQSLQLRIVAEGVETAQELELLQMHQCDEAQGYYFSRPIVAKQFAKLLKTGIPKGSRPQCG